MKKFLCMMVLAGVFTVANAGEAAYPIGVYGVFGNDRYFAEMKEAGINFVHYYGTSKDTPAAKKQTETFLAGAEKHGLEVMFCLRAGAWAKQPDGIAGAVEHFRPYAARAKMLLLDDEPKEHELKNIENANLALKAAFPQLKTAVVEQWATGWWRYGKSADAGDILMLDAYPVGDQPFPIRDAMLNYSRFMSAGFKLGKPLMPVIQLCNLNVFPQVVKQRGLDAAKCRFPNAAEMRFMTWMPVVRGATGVFYYSLARAVQRDPKGEWLRGVFFPLVKELREFSELAAPLEQATERQTGADESFYAAHWKRGERSFTVVCNNRPEPQECQLSLPCKGFKPYGGTRPDVKIENGAVTLQPWETIILENEY